MKKTREVNGSWDNLSDQPFYEEETWSKGLSREQTLEKQTQLIAYNYSKGFWNEFEYSLKALIPLLPKQVRDEFPPLEHDITTEGVARHYKQFTDLQSYIEENTNMMYKKKFVKTYE